MGYKIKDLPPALQTLAMQRAIEGGLPNITIETEVIGAFSWDRTPEGEDYWNHVYDSGESNESLIRDERDYDDEEEDEEDYDEEDQIIK